MTKKITVLLLILSLLMSFVGCGCEHKWKEATCTQPKNCKLCGETEGSAIEHSYEEATCTSPKICKLCGETEGSAIEHSYEEATCTSPKICKVCHLETGDSLGHNFADATYDAPKTCQQCGKTEGEKLKLNSSFDKVLASGYEGSDFYELVANQNVDYDGAPIEFAVLKNNKYLRKLSKNYPFFDKDGSLYGRDAVSIYDECIKFDYIGNGCFVYGYEEDNKYSTDKYYSILYNSETKKYYIAENHIGYLGKVSVEDFADLSSIIDKNNPYIFVKYESDYRNKGYETQITMLNTNNMKLSTINICLKSDHPRVICPISEKIFGVVSTNLGTLEFFDINGKKIINKEFYLYDYQPIRFIDGKCTFISHNPSNKNKYKVTIDKTGKTISSHKLEN